MSSSAVKRVEEERCSAPSLSAYGWNIITQLLIQQTLGSRHNPTPLMFDDAVWRNDQNRLHPVCIVKSKTELPQRDGEVYVCVCPVHLRMFRCSGSPTPCGSFKHYVASEQKKYVCVCFTVIVCVTVTFQPYLHTLPP